MVYFYSLHHNINQHQPPTSTTTNNHQQQSINFHSTILFHTKTWLKIAQLKWKCLWLSLLKRLETSLFVPRINCVKCCQGWTVFVELLKLMRINWNLMRINCKWLELTWCLWWVTKPPKHPGWRPWRIWSKKGLIWRRTLSTTLTVRRLQRMKSFWRSFVFL